MSIQMLGPLTAESPLDVKLKLLTGDGYSSRRFHSEHAPSTLAGAGVITHKATGEKFFIPIKVDVDDSLNCEHCLAPLRDAYHSGGKGAFPLTVNREVADAGLGFSETELKRVEHLDDLERTLMRQLESFGLIEVLDEPEAGDPTIELTALGKEAFEGYQDYLLERLQENRLVAHGEVPYSVMMAAKVYAGQAGEPREPVSISALGQDEALVRVWLEMRGMKPFSTRNFKDDESLAALRRSLRILEMDGAKYLSPQWVDQVGYQVQVFLFGPSGKMKYEGLVSLGDTQSFAPRENILGELIARQRVVRKGVLESGSYDTVLMDTPANDTDYLYCGMYCRKYAGKDLAEFAQRHLQSDSMMMDAAEVEPQVRSPQPE